MFGGRKLTLEHNEIQILKVGWSTSCAQMAEHNYNREMDKSDQVTSIIALWACWTSEAAEVIVHKYKYKYKCKYKYK